MKLDYSNARLNFHKTARSRADYRPAYRLLFSTLLDMLEEKNMFAEDHGRFIRVDFEATILCTGQNRKTFYEGLNWLNDNGYIDYGKLNKDIGLTEILNLNPVKDRGIEPANKVIATVTSEVTHTVSSPVQVVTNEGTKLVTAPVTTEVTGKVNKPEIPPHPPIEEKNNIITTTATAADAAAAGHGLIFPKNISLEDWQIDALLKKEPVEVLNEAIFMLSGMKLAKGSRQPDYFCLTDFMIGSAKKRLAGQKAPPDAKPARLPHSTLPVSVSGILPRPRSRQPD